MASLSCIQYQTNTIPHHKIPYKTISQWHIRCLPVHNIYPAYNDLCILPIVFVCMYVYTVQLKGCNVQCGIAWHKAMLELSVSPFSQPDTCSEATLYLWRPSLAFLDCYLLPAEVGWVGRPLSCLPMGTMGTAFLSRPNKFGQGCQTPLS